MEEILRYPANPRKGQIFTFTDYCPGKGYFSSSHIYTGDRWVKMRTQDPSPKVKVQSITGRIKPIKHGAKR